MLYRYGLLVCCMKNGLLLIDLNVCIGELMLLGSSVCVWVNRVWDWLWFMGCFGEVGIG